MKLKASCIANKIRLFAKKAGINGFHTHSMRHKFTTDTMERGGDLKALQELLGHTSLPTTEVYLSVTGQRLRQTVDLLDGPKIKEKDKVNDTAEWIQPVVY